MSYRIYLTSDDGRLQLGPTFEASGDVDAVSRLSQLVSPGRTAELWQGGRLVGHLSADGVFARVPKR